MPRLESRSHLARLAGVSPAAITKAAKTRLAAACKGDRIDLDHPAVAAYLADKGRKLPPKAAKARTAAKPDRTPTKAAKKAPKRAPQPTTPRRAPAARPKKRVSEAIDTDALDPDSPEFIERYGHLTHAQLVRAFGTVRALRDVLDALKKREDIRGKRLENDEADGHLISRELVKTHVFAAIEGCHRRLLQDLPRTISRRNYAAANSGTPIEDSEEVTRELISSVLEPVMTAIAKVLRDKKP